MKRMEGTTSKASCSSL